MRTLRQEHLASNDRHGAAWLSSPEKTVQTADLTLSGSGQLAFRSDQSKPLPGITVNYALGRANVHLSEASSLAFRAMARSGASGRSIWPRAAPVRARRAISRPAHGGLPRARCPAVCSARALPDGLSSLWQTCLFRRCGESDLGGVDTHAGHNRDGTCRNELKTAFPP